MELVNAFKKGDWLTRSSAIVMGLGNILRKQFIKGLIPFHRSSFPILYGSLWLAVPSGTAGPW